MSSTSSNLAESPSLGRPSLEMTRRSTKKSSRSTSETSSFPRRRVSIDAMSKTKPTSADIGPTSRSTFSAKSISRATIKSCPIEPECIKVAVRCRPMSEKEIADGHESIIELACERCEIIIRNPNLEPSNLLGTRKTTRRNHSKVFKFDAVFGWNSEQDDIYNEVCRPIVNSVLQGFNGTIFAYGQTGTGKTYTMEGVNSTTHTSSTTRRASSTILQSRDQEQKTNKDLRGIIPKAFEHIFGHITENITTQYLVRSSYMEIYQEEIRDLLGKDHSKRLELHEHPEVGVYVKDLTSFVCKSIKEIERVMKVGNQNRSVGATDMNEHSSRSHAIFMITIEQQNTRTTFDDSANSNNNPLLKIANTDNNNRPLIKVGKLNLVDLAGSERQRKTNSLGQRQKEAIKINLSLSALGNVINSLMSASSIEQTNKSNNNDLHIPYRDSKLTRLLQDSLGGNAKTLMLANIGPASYNYDETIDTLSYASRAKCIQNRPRINEDPKDALLREFQREIETLKTRLATIKRKKQENDGISVNTSDTNAEKKKGLSVESDESNSDINGTDLWVHQQQQQQRKSSLPDQSRVNQQINTNNQHDEQYKELQSLISKLKSLESKLLNSQDNGVYNGDDEQQQPINKQKQQTAIDAIKSTTTTMLDKSNNLDIIIEGYTSKQQSELEKRRQQLANFKEIEQDIRLKLSRQEELELETKQTFSSLQQELDMKTTKLKSIESHIQLLKKEIEILHNSNRLELDELDQVQGVLLKELKLKYLIMNNFIPKEYSDRLFEQKLLVYNDKDNTCHLKPSLTVLNQQASSSNPIKTNQCDDSSDTTPKPIAMPRYRNDESLRARSKFERIAESIGTNIRYRYKNILEERLIVPKCTLRSYQAPLISPKIQAALDGALSKQEKDIFI